MRVLGVDPGTATTGYGLVEEQAGELTAIQYGVIETASRTPLSERLLTLYEQLGQCVLNFGPDVLAVEELFFSRNVQTAFSVGQARGVVLLVAAQHGLPVSEYTPPQVKLAIAGYGAATKPQMQAMVQRLLELDAIPKPDDAADALAVAICHARTAPMNRAVRRALAGNA